MSIKLTNYTHINNSTISHKLAHIWRQTNSVSTSRRRTETAVMTWTQNCSQCLCPWCRVEQCDIQDTSYRF